MRRVYTDTAHFRAPYDTPNISFAGLGSDWQRVWPKGRTYYDVSQFRAPYDDGYYQSGGLRGIGSAPPELWLGLVSGAVAGALVVAAGGKGKPRLRQTVMGAAAGAAGVAASMLVVKRVASGA